MNNFDEPRDFLINGVELRNTCYACPEQYDAFMDGVQVGYLRLRHGRFYAACHDVGGHIVYSASPTGDGIFEPDERELHLTNAVDAIVTSQSTGVLNPKQVIIMRDDLGMTKGKMIAQGAHASMGAIFTRSVMSDSYGMHIDTKDPYINAWINGSFTKICVRITGTEELITIIDKAKELGMPAALIIDNGLTMFKGVKTITCGAIGPWSPEEINKLTGHLKLY